MWFICSLRPAGSTPCLLPTPPRVAATQLARSSVLNRLIAPAGLSPALTPASRAHHVSRVDPNGSFTWRDYRDPSKLKQLTLATREFVRRFCLHILPPRLVRIRHYGILANNRRRRDIRAARAILVRSGRELHVELPKDEGPRCPKCGKAGLRMVGFTQPDGTFHSLAKSPPLHDTS